jgi:hypothetical protein
VDYPRRRADAMTRPASYRVLGSSGHLKLNPVISR